MKNIKFITKKQTIMVCLGNLVRVVHNQPIVSLLISEYIYFCFLCDIIQESEVLYHYDIRRNL